MAVARAQGHCPTTTSPTLSCSSASRCAHGSGKCQRSPRVWLTLNFQSQKHLFQQTENQNSSKKHHFVRAGGLSPPRPTLWPLAPRAAQGHPPPRTPRCGAGRGPGVPGSQLQTSEQTAPGPGQALGPEESSRGPGHAAHLPMALGAGLSQATAGPGFSRQHWQEAHGPHRVLRGVAGDQNWSRQLRLPQRELGEEPRQSGSPPGVCGGGQAQTL